MTRLNGRWYIGPRKASNGYVISNINSELQLTLPYIENRVAVADFQIDTKSVKSVSLVVDI